MSACPHLLCQGSVQGEPPPSGRTCRRRPLPLLLLRVGQTVTANSKDFNWIFGLPLVGVSQA